MLSMTPSRTLRPYGVSSSQRALSVGLAYFSNTSLVGPTCVSVSMILKPAFTAPSFQRRGYFSILNPTRSVPSQESAPAVGRVARRGVVPPRAESYYLVGSIRLWGDPPRRTARHPERACDDHRHGAAGRQQLDLAARSTDDPFRSSLRRVRP